MGVEDVWGLTVCAVAGRPEVVEDSSTCARAVG